jgi:hypothetical protein
MNLKSLGSIAVLTLLYWTGNAQIKTVGMLKEAKPMPFSLQPKSAFTTDTLGPLLDQDSVALYAAPSGGFVTGVNGFNDREKAQVFKMDTVYGITEVLFLFGGKTYSGDTSSTLYVNFYKANGIGRTLGSNSDIGAPGDILAQIPYPFSNVDTSGFASLPLTWPITVDTDFAISISFWDLVEGDTIALFSGYNGQADSTQLAWEKLNSGTWTTFLRSWPLDADLAIFPIIDYQFTGLLENKIQNCLAYPNPAADYLEVVPFRAGKKGMAYLIDVEGKIVLQKTFNPLENSYLLNTQNLPNGYYTLLSSVDGLTQKAKVLITRP